MGNDIKLDTPLSGNVAGASQPTSSVAVPKQGAGKPSAPKQVANKPSPKATNLQVSKAPISSTPSSSAGGVATTAPAATKPETYSWFNLPKLETPVVSTESVMLELRNLQKILSSKELKADKTGVTLHDEQIQSIHQKNIAQAKKIAAKLKKINHESIWEKIIGWLSNVINLIASVIATVVTAGAAAPLLVAAVLGTAMMILQQTGGMKKIVKGFVKMFEAFGMSKDKAERAGAITAAVTVAVVMIVSSIVSTVLSGGADSAALAATIYQVTKIVNEVAGAGLMITQGSIDITSGVDQYTVSEDRADQQSNEADLKNLDFLRGISSSDVQRVSEDFQKIEGFISDALKSQAQSQELSIRNMA